MNRAAFDEISGHERVWIPLLNSTFALKKRLEKKAIADLKQQYNLTAANVKRKIWVFLGILGASSNKSVSQLYPLAAVCFIIILVSGVFMISSCMNSNATQRTAFLG